MYVTQAPGVKLGEVGSCVPLEICSVVATEMMGIGLTTSTMQRVVPGQLGSVGSSPMVKEKSPPGGRVTGPLEEVAAGSYFSNQTKKSYFMHLITANADFFFTWHTNEVVNGFPDTGTNCTDPTADCTPVPAITS